MANIQLSRDEYDAAEQTYRSIVYQQPNFGRAVLGLAEVERLRGMSECSSGRPGPHLARSEELLRDAVLRDNEPGALVAEKVILGRVRLELCTGELEPDLSAQLDATVVELLGSPLGEALGADALLVRGFVFLSLSKDHDDLERARQDLESVIFDLPFTAGSRAVAEWSLGGVYIDLGQESAAIEALESAIEDYENQKAHADAEGAEEIQHDIDQIRAKLDELRQG